MNKKLEQKFLRLLLPKKGVIGFDLSGEKRVKGKKTGKGAILVAVEKKKPLKDIAKKDLIPEKIDGWHTDVIEIGKIKIPDTLYRPLAKTSSMDRTARYDPFCMGLSGGHPLVTAGSLGFLAKLAGDTSGRRFLTTNNHVGAALNEGKIGDPFYHPGPYDGGTPAENIIGTLHSYPPIIFRQHWFIEMIKKWMGKPSPTNIVDCCLIEINDPDSCIPWQAELGTVTGKTIAKPGMTAWGTGRTQAVTSAEVISTDLTLVVGLGTGKSGIFSNMIFIQPGDFAAGGDSGKGVHIKTGKKVNSWILRDGKKVQAETDELKAVGKLFAGSDQAAIAMHIDNVIEALNIELI